VQQVTPETSGTGQAPGEPTVDQYKLLTDLLNRNTRWAEVADAKAGAVLFFTGASARILMEPIIDSATELYDEGLNNLSSGAALLHIAFVVVTIVVVAALFWTIYHAFVTLVPRVRRSGAGRGGVMFFGDLARIPYAEWRERILGYSEQDVLDDLAGQVHTAGVIASQKHQHIKHAVSGILVVLALSPVLYILAQAIS
jgi:hypothetical protein